MRNRHQPDTINVLVVDDVAQNIAAVEAVLARPELRLLRASSGTAALELLLVHDVALALIDVRMPGMDGFELAELMRGAERSRTVPIIFMTAAANDPRRTFRGYEAGAVDFLHKPLDPHILRSKVDVFVELYEQRRTLAAQLEELKNALRLNEMFTAALGHDLRNPLNAISMGAEVLVRRSRDPELVNVAERIVSSARRMGRMIGQLLDVARIRSGGIELTMRPSDISRVCRSIMEEVVAPRDAARVNVTATGDTTAVFDVDRLSQVFSNLVGNALQHSETSSPVSVSINGSHPEAVRVQIRNEGVIPADQMRTLFEPFRSGNPSQGGLGLGLYIARQFVQAHGGTVEARSGTDRQTTFEVSIPRNPAGNGEPLKATL
jgi:signal transduction histidine kinase